MNFRKLALATSIISSVIIGCTNTQTGQKESVSETDSPKIQESVVEKTNYEMLQGKWQSEDDNTNFLVFEKNRRKEIAEGMDKWDEEEFVLSDHCENEANQSDNNEKVKDSYISCKESDNCWYIMSLTEERLTLQYLGRGNTLIYKRVKE